MKRHTRFSDVFQAFSPTAALIYTASKNFKRVLRGSRFVCTGGVIIPPNANARWIFLNGVSPGAVYFACYPCKSSS